MAVFYSNPIYGYEENHAYHHQYDNNQYPSLLFLPNHNIFFALHYHLHLAILHSAVKLSHSLALTCCAESINILYYNIIFVVNIFHKQFCQRRHKHNMCCNRAGRIIYGRYTCTVGLCGLDWVPRASTIAVFLPLLSYS